MTEQKPTPQEQKQKNFTCSPNMLFVSYRHLTIEEKYLWMNLKRVYWDGKPRYMGLREWSEATGYSTGALSKMFPRLHTCKLLDAVMERENGKGNAKYRITVLDITDLNKQYYSCSPNERVLLDPSLELVHENTQACSPNERPRSRKRTRSFTKPDKPVHENGQENAVDPPVESDDNAPKDLLIDPLKTSLQMNEDSGLPPTSSPSDDSSFIHSSDLNSSGEDTQPPLQPGDSPIAMPPDTDQGEVKPPDSDASQCAGLYEEEYRGDVTQGETPPSDGNIQGDNVPPDSALSTTTYQSVMPNETVTEAQLLGWLATLEKEETEGKVKHFAIGRIAEKKADMQRLLSAVSSLDQARELYKIVRSQKLFSDGRIIWGTNLAKGENIALLQQAASQPQEIDRDEPMDQVQADHFAQWLMQQPGLSWDTVAIDSPLPGIWVTCIRVADNGKDDDWYPFGCPEYYLDPTPYDQEQIARSKALLAVWERERANEIAAQEQREAVAV